MQLEVLSGSFGWLNENVSTSMVPSQYKKQWSKFLKGDISAIENHPTFRGGIRVGKNSIDITAGGETFNYLSDKDFVIKNGRILKGAISTYSRETSQDVSILSGFKVSIKKMLASIAVLTLPNKIRSEILANGGKGPGIYGFSGKDIIISDSPVISGGIGADILTGGSSSNTFILDIPSENTIDVITNFSRSEGDKLGVRLSSSYSSGYSGLENTSDQGLVTYGGSDVFGGDSARFHLNASTGALFFDPDGRTGAASVAQIATLQGVTMLGIEDFSFSY